MLAVVKLGNRQYAVRAGDVIAVEKLSAAVGERLALAEVLLAAEGERVSVGRPFVDGVRVEAEVVGHGRAPRVEVFKFRRRKNYRRRRGHRQPYTLLKVLSVGASSGQAA